VAHGALDCDEEPSQTPGWVFMKTVQHNGEHTNSIALISLRLSLPR
jgi:hypothetical protein